MCLVGRNKGWTEGIILQKWPHGKITVKIYRENKYLDVSENNISINRIEYKRWNHDKQIIETFIEK